MQQSFNHIEQREDEIIWTRTMDEEYSASSTYTIQFEGSTQSSFPCKVWKVWAPSRCKFFLWLMLQNRIWTADQLQLREWPSQYFCLLCHRNLETVTHLFSECLVVRQIWTQIANWASLSAFQPQKWSAGEPIADWFNGLTSSSSTPKARGARSLAILVCWTIWRERNARVFDGHEKSVDRLVTEIKNEAALWNRAG
jgi:hypothetical protein